MPLTAEQRKTMIEGLVTNCGCQGQTQNTPWTGKDRAVLEGLSDNELVMMDQCRQTIAGVQANVANAHKGMVFSDGAGNQFRANFQTGRMEIVTPGAPPPNAPTGNVSQNTATAAALAANAQHGVRQQTEEEYLKNAPPGVQAKFQLMEQIQNQMKDSYVQELVGNALPAGEQRTLVENYYRAKDLTELQAALNIKRLTAPPPVQAPAPQQLINPLASWFGAQGVQPTEMTTNEDPLDSPDYSNTFESPGARRGKAELARS